MASSLLVWHLLALIWLPKLSMWCTDAFWGMLHIWHVSVLDQFLTPIEFVLRCSRSINLWTGAPKFELCIDTSPSTWHSTPGWLDLIGTNQVFAFKPFFATRANTSEWPWGPTIMWFLSFATATAFEMQKHYTLVRSRPWVADTKIDFAQDTINGMPFCQHCHKIFKHGGDARCTDDSMYVMYHLQLYLLLLSLLTFLLIFRIIHQLQWKSPMTMRISLVELRFLPLKQIMTVWCMIDLSVISWRPTAFCAPNMWSHYSLWHHTYEPITLDRCRRP